MEESSSTSSSDSSSSSAASFPLTAIEVGVNGERSCTVIASEMEMMVDGSSSSLGIGGMDIESNAKDVGVSGGTSSTASKISSRWSC